MDVLLLSYLCIFLMQSSEGLRCLSCNGVVHPLLCDRIKQCEQNEVCLTEKYVTSYNEELFNVGCFSKNSCFNTTTGHPQYGYAYLSAHLSPDDKLKCASCCEGDACNKNTCDNIGFDFQRGPLCYNCKQTRDPSLCSFVKSCEPNQVCRTEELSFSGLTLYSSSCSANSNCHGHVGTAFGKRKRSSYEKIKCCHGDLCNDKGTDSLSTKTATLTTFVSTQSSFKATLASTIATTAHSIWNPFDCMDIYRHKPYSVTSAYSIYLGPKNSRRNVYCDMETDGGGWTVLLSRNDRISTNWNRTWEEYKNGFGDVLLGNHWIGNKYIYWLTFNRSVELYVKLQADNPSWYYAKYENFSVGPESDNYRLHYDNSSFSGNAGNGFWGTGDRSRALQGKPFSTIDRDNDPASINCAASYGGGWWYSSCFSSALTLTRSSSNVWQTPSGTFHFKVSYMMIRHKTKTT